MNKKSAIIIAHSHLKSEKVTVSELVSAKDNISYWTVIFSMPCDEDVVDSVDKVIVKIDKKSSIPEILVGM